MWLMRIFLFLASALQLSISILANLFLSTSTGRVQECSLERPYPKGYDCLYSPITFGIKSCHPSPEGGFAKHTGSCPTEGKVDFTFFRSTCDFDHECAMNQKCCYHKQIKQKTCKRASRILFAPKIVVLQAGNAPRDPGAQGVAIRGTIALIQSSGKNILVDTGTPTQKADLERNLLDLAGIDASGIDFVVTTHGHPDHYSNSNIFPDIPNNFWTFTGIGSKYLVNPLATNQRLFVLSDQNVEIVKTPGHTAEDTSVIIRNVPNLGTVIVAGDIILERQDEGLWEKFAVDEAQQRDSRRLIFCAADYVVPGHGPMFRVTFDMKRRYAC